MEYSMAEVYDSTINSVKDYIRAKDAAANYKRSDDDFDTILKRYDTYMKTTQPVLNFYSENPNFKEIDGSLEIEEITRKINAFINV